MPDIKLEITGIKELEEAFKKFNKQTTNALKVAGLRVSEEVVQRTVGLQQYPPASEANYPPTPYYIRGRGTQRGGKGGEHNDMSSEKLGSRWFTEQDGYTTKIGNNASYAKYVHGDEQAGHMAIKGWRKLSEVFAEKLGRITEIYQQEIDKLLKKLGLT
jgi:hypothetical protein